MSPILAVLLVLGGWGVFVLLVALVVVAALRVGDQRDAARCDYLDRELDKLLGRHAADPQIPDPE